MKIFITGANGLVGQKLVHEFGKYPNYEIIASGRGPCRGSFENIQYAELDLTDRDKVQHTLSEIRPSVLIHSAAMTQIDPCETDHEECLRHNVDATENLIDACQEFIDQFVYLSTDFVFDGLSGPYNETDIPNPVNFYGHSKLEGERRIMESGIAHAIVRTVLVYGVTPGQSRSNIVLWVLENLKNNKPIRVVNDQYRTPTLAEDLAHGCALVVQKKAHGIFHISGNEMMTPYDLALTTARHFGLDESLISPTNAKEFVEVGKRPPKTGFNISKAMMQLGYKPHTFGEGLEVVATFV